MHQGWLNLPQDEISIRFQTAGKIIHSCHSLTFPCMSFQPVMSIGWGWAARNKRNYRIESSQRLPAGPEFHLLVEWIVELEFLYFAFDRAFQSSTCAWSALLFSYLVYDWHAHAFWSQADLRWQPLPHSLP